jgi:4-hydroxybenzoate polyprenyltransferase
MVKSSEAARIADAIPGHWVTRFLPSAIQPFAQLMRLDRPIGWWLLLLPCLWGQALAHVATGTRFNWILAILFLIGAIVMRGAGCVVNDILDRKIDAKVERTRHRPIASGRVSVTAALVFLVLLLLCGLAVLLQFNINTIALGFMIVPIVGVYPLMKRFTHYPQIVLGIAFNWGVLVGWSAVVGSVSIAPILLYIGSVFWTFGYDTIYAHQDKQDDAIVGVYSTALKFGDKTPIVLIVSFGVMIVLTVCAMLAVGGRFGFIGVAAAALHAAWQVARFDGDDPKICLNVFKSNRTFGLLILAGIFMDTRFQ